MPPFPRPKPGYGDEYRVFVMIYSEDAVPDWKILVVPHPQYGAKLFDVYRRAPGRWRDRRRVGMALSLPNAIACAQTNLRSL